MARVSKAPRSRAVGFTIAGLVLAVVSAANAAGNVLQRHAPALSVSAVPENGRAYAEAAHDVLKLAVVENDGEMPEQIPARAVLLAKRGFTSEPLAPQNSWIVALDRDAQGDREGARALMRAVSTATRRESPANLWLGEDYARLEDDENLYRYLDLTVRTSASARPVVLPQLVGALASVDAVKPLSILLEGNPPWARDFWREAVRRPQFAGNLSRLRMALGKADETRAASAAEDTFQLSLDRAILESLIERNQLAEAASFYGFLSSSQPSAEFTSDFAQAPVYPPFDWDLAQEGEYGASVIPSRGRVLLSGINGARGVAARRLLKLEQGRFRVTLEGMTSTSQAATLQVRTRCVGATSVTPIPMQAEGESLTGQWEVASKPCDWYWLELQINVPSDSDPADIEFSTISVSKQ